MNLFVLKSCSGGWMKPMVLKLTKIKNSSETFSNMRVASVVVSVDYTLGL